MATKEGKKGRRKGDETNTNTNTSMGVDLISELPDPLIHHILSFLPTFYAVRMSILSKRWRNMWIYIPVLYLEDFKYDLSFQKMFEFVSNYLKHRKLLSSQFSADTCITRFKLDMQMVRSPLLGNLIEKTNDWLGNVVRGNNLKELDLCIKPIRYSYLFRSSYFVLLRSVLNSTSLTLLTLKRLELAISFPVSLPSLKALCLESMKHCCYDNSVQNLISGCPILQDLRLGAFNFRICQTKDVVMSGTLKSLTLWDTTLSSKELDYLICGFPILEKLTMSCCCRSTNICIRSHSLKSLILRLNADIEAKITTPNLVHFVFASCVETTIPIFDAPKLLEANLELYDPCLFRTYFLIRFLSYFKCLKKMTLRLCFEEDFTILNLKDVKNICCPPLPALKHLKVKTHRAFKRNSELRDIFLWCAASLETLDFNGEISSKL